MAPSADKAPLLSVRDLKVHYGGGRRLFRGSYPVVRAVDGVDFSVGHGETLGLVGESGCGKSTLGRAVLALSHVSSGDVELDGEPVLGRSPAEMRAMRRRMRMIFQDPQSALNPRMTVSQLIGEAFDIEHKLKGPERDSEVRQLMKVVGLRDDQFDRYPHEFSGGQRQRIGIARALALRPSLIVCDEPVSALDVSIQAQVLNLLADLQQSYGLSFLFISHDLRVVQFMAHRVAVMYLGRIVEIADRAALYRQPTHPYTQALMASAPLPDPRQRRQRKPLQGEMPNPLHPPSGCAFHPRCPLAIDRCRAEMPPLAPIASGHAVRCWRAEEAAGLMQSA